MPTPDLEERFRRWLKLTAEMHENANFTANDSIAWAPMSKPLTECAIALISMAGVHLKSQPAHNLLDPHGGHINQISSVRSYKLYSNNSLPFRPQAR